MSTETEIDLTDLGMARSRAAEAHSAANEIRRRLAAGDMSIEGSDLAEAEALERITALQLESAEQHTAAEQERQAAIQLQADRVAMQEKWAAAVAPDPKIDALLDRAVEVAMEFVRAAHDRNVYRENLAAEAAALGFDVGTVGWDRPLHVLGRRILDEARAVLPVDQIMPRLDSPADGAWGERL